MEGDYSFEIPAAQTDPVDTMLKKVAVYWENAPYRAESNADGKGKVMAFKLKTKEPSASGLYDFPGLLYEISKSRYGDYPPKEVIVDDHHEPINPLINPGEGSYRVMRGTSGRLSAPA